MKSIVFGLALCALMMGQPVAAPHKPALNKLSKKAASGRSAQRFVPGSYIVELNGQGAVAGVKSASAQMGRIADHRSLMQQHRGRVAKEQSLMRPMLEAKGARVHHSVDIVMNAMMVKYSGRRQDLEALPGVKHVYPVRMLKRHLDRATTVTQVTDVWMKIGGFANAGAA